MFHNLSNPIDDCNHDHRDHNPGVDEYHHVGLSDGYPREGIDDGLDTLDHNSDVDYNDDKLDDGLYGLDDATSVHDNVDLDDDDEFDDGLYGVDDATSVHDDNVDLDDDVDDPDFYKSLVSINDTNSDDVGEDEYIHDDDQYSHYDISDYSQVVVKSHDMKHSDYYFCNAYKYVIRMIS